MRMHRSRKRQDRLLHPNPSPKGEGLSICCTAAQKLDVYVNVS